MRDAVRPRAAATTLARMLSIGGHPLVLMSAAALAAWPGHDGARWQLAAGLGAIAALVMGYWHLRVRRGAWAHVDASDRGERRDLNRMLAVLLFVALLLGVWREVPPPVTVVLGLCAAIVGLSALAARWCKPSLHLAFACLATGILGLAWAQVVLPMGLFVLAVGWSRLHLQRHTIADMVAGVLLGTGAAWCCGWRPRGSRPEIRRPSFSLVAPSLLGVADLSARRRASSALQDERVHSGS